MTPDDGRPGGERSGDGRPGPHGRPGDRRPGDGWPGPDDAPRRRPDIVAVEVEGEAVLYDPITERLLRLSPVATVLWRYLDGTTTLRDLAADLGAAAPTGSSSAAEEGLRRHVTDLAELGLLVRPPVDADPPAPHGTDGVHPRHPYHPA